MAQQPDPKRDIANYGRLPRSIKWRLRLGLLQSTTSNAFADDVVFSLEDVIQQNQTLLQDEQSHYEELKATYHDHFKAKIKDDELASNENDVPLEVNQEDGVLLVDVNLQRGGGGEIDPLSSASASTAIATAMIDPLQAMLMEQQAQERRRQELDLKYRKEKARRNRGLDGHKNETKYTGDSEETTKAPDTDTLSIIDKDLHRLPSPGIIAWTSDSDERRKDWTDALREVLYIFSQENPHIGYRQGMHEVASYLWLVLQLDKADVGQSATQSTPVLSVFDKPALYSILRSILSDMRQAFDVKTSSNSKPLQEMSHSILAKIKQQHTHHGLQDQLCPLLLSLSVPPQLYCTKWIRLLFSREISGTMNVIMLWDTFIELVSENWEWMAILETTAACRILLCRDQLLETKPDDTQASQHHRVMNLLMNMPAMDDIEPLVTRLRGLLELQKYQLVHHDVVSSQPQPDGTQMQPSNNPGSRLSQYSDQNPLQSGYVFAEQPRQQQSMARGLSDDLSAVFSINSMKSLRQGLEQGVGKLATGSDAWKEKLVTGWNGFKRDHASSAEERNYMVDYDVSGNRVILEPNANGWVLSEQQQQQQQLQQPMQQQLPQKLVAQPGQASQSTLSLQQSQELAARLGYSVAKLQEFVMSVARTAEVQQPGYPRVSSANSVPSAVWEALADVDAVRNALLQQQR